MPLSGSVFQPEHPEGENLSGWQVYIIPDNKIGIFSLLFPASDLYLPVVDKTKIKSNGSSKEPILRITRLDLPAEQATETGNPVKGDQVAVVPSGWFAVFNLQGGA